MGKKKASEKPIINIFITHKHSTGEKYLERVKELIKRCSELESVNVDYQIYYDTGVLAAGQDYSALDAYYDITDVDILLLSDGAKDSQWVMQEIKDMQDRKIRVIPLFFEGEDINDVKPECVNVRHIDLRDGHEATSEELEQLAKVLVKRESAKRKNRKKLNKFGNRIWSAFISGGKEELVNGAEELGKKAGSLLPLLLIIPVLAVLVFVIMRLCGNDISFWEVFKEIFEFLK